MQPIKSKLNLAWWAILSAIFLLPMVLEAQEIVVYMKTGEKIRGKLISITKSKIQFDPVGNVSFRTIEITKVDTINSVDSDGRILHTIYPADDLPDNVSFQSQKPKRSFRAQPHFSMSWFGGYRTPVKILKITILHPVTYEPSIFEAKLESGRGMGGSFSTLFPLTRSGLLLSFDLEIAYLSADWFFSNKSNDITVSTTMNGSVTSFDGSFGFKIPFGNNASFFITPAVGGGLRKFSAKSDDNQNVEEQHTVIFGSLKIEFFPAEQFSFMAKTMVWNSDLEDLFFAEVPRFSAFELHFGLTYYFRW